MKAEIKGKNEENFPLAYKMEQNSFPKKFKKIVLSKFLGEQSHEIVFEH